MQNKYIQVIEETPILNTPDFLSVFGGEDRKTIKTDIKGHIRALEFIALKGFTFKAIKKMPHPYIYMVNTFIYPNKEIYIDSRFTQKTKKPHKTMPALSLNKDEITNRLISLIGVDYIWGGNLSRGVVKFFNCYSPKNFEMEEKLKRKWMLKGVDCSGYLFEVTNGFTPRNTTELMKYKNPVIIEHLNAQEIAKIVKPLDIIVFKGHVIIILDSMYTIESLENQGVIKLKLVDRLKDLLKTKTPANTYKTSNDFVIRRWFNKRALQCF